MASLMDQLSFGALTSTRDYLEQEKAMRRKANQVPELEIESRRTVWVIEVFLTPTIDTFWCGMYCVQGTIAFLDRLSEILEDGASNTWQRPMTPHERGYWMEARCQLCANVLTD
jgi:hypothetical protein